ncbi:MAG TPA: hypothetical protein VJB63_01790 [Patescibacteria group bacterium]|nr:hypothetical protein [Patescibacteria group bacterium]
MDSEIFQTTGNCTIDECEAQEEGDFFDHTDFIGLSEVRGYYHRYESEDFGTPVTCDGFVISEENNQFTIRLRNFITKEKLYLKDRLTFDNKLIMNIEMDFLDQPLKKKIISSSETKQVELRFMAPMLIPRGVSTCFSSVNILSVK